jgi:DNA-binding response OmpR family regulator
MPAHGAPIGHILIIDDDQGVTDSFSRLLKLEGYDVRTAQSAEVGLREAERESPDAIILDLRMPWMDGLGFLRELRAHDRHRHVQVAIVTGDYFLDDELATELHSLGAELKYKPLWLDDLVELARTLVAHDPEPRAHLR